MALTATHRELESVTQVESFASNLTYDYTFTDIYGEGSNVFMLNETGILSLVAVAVGSPKVNSTTGEQPVFNTTRKEMSLPDDAILRICFYSSIFVLSVVGNALVITTLAQNKRMRTVTNVFLLNLAISDLLLGVFCMPFTLVGSLLRNFIFGEAICRLISYFQAVSVSVSVWTLVSISLERYFAICRPLHSRRWQTISHAYKVIVLVWFCSLITMIPTAVLSRLIPTNMPGRHKCREVWPSIESERGFNIYLNVVLLCIPLVIMIMVYSLITRTLCKGIKVEMPGKKGSFSSQLSKFSKKSAISEKVVPSNNGILFVNSSGGLGSPKGKSSQQLVVRGNYEKNQAAKMRVIKMLFVVVVEFFICWTPLYVINTWTLFDPGTVYKTLGMAGISAVHLLAYISCCCNPVTYCFMHKKFRQGFLSVVGCKPRHRWQHGRGSERGGTMVSVFSTRETFDKVEENSL